MAVWASVGTVALGAVLVLGRPSCAKLGGKADAGDAATVASVVPVPVVSPFVDASAPPMASDGGDAGARISAADAAAVERSRQWLEDLRWCIEHKATVNPEKSGEGDAASKCDAVAEASAGLTAASPPAYRKNLDEASELCALDVHLLNAREAIDRQRFSSSQASHLLQCDIAKRELDAARTVKPRTKAKDAELNMLDGRRIGVCH